MQPATRRSGDTRRAVSEPQQFPPLEQVNRPTVPTEQAAYCLSRKPETCRAWAGVENRPLRPHRVMGRLAWSVAEIRTVLGVAQRWPPFTNTPTATKSRWALAC